MVFLPLFASRVTLSAGSQPPERLNIERRDAGDNNRPFLKGFASAAVLMAVAEIVQKVLDWCDSYMIMAFWESYWVRA